MSIYYVLKAVLSVEIKKVTEGQTLEFRTPGS